MKRKSNSQSIGEVLHQFLKENRLDQKIIQQSIIDSWELIAGKMIKNHTKNLFFKAADHLYIELDSDVIRHEVFMRKSEIISAINTFACAEIVKNLIIK